MIIRKAKKADIGLLLEGTFPFVSGGVSSWVNQIIRGFPQYTFAICFIGSRRQDYGDMRYELPDNVVHLEAHFIHDADSNAPVAPRKGDPRMAEKMRELHSYFRAPKSEKAKNPTQDIVKAFREGRYSEQDFLYSKTSWNYITEQYRERCTDPSFVDYFWTVRIMHAPIWQLIRISEGFPEVGIYHTVSTGYAGYLGALLQQYTNKPLLLTEHGIYTKERKIDLFQAQWISDNRGVMERDSTEIAYFRQMWVRFFDVLGRECYQHAARILSLYEANRQRQITDGAPAERTACIPNGIDYPRFEAVRTQREPGVPHVICFIGRVVPIKDVKSFIRAMRTVVNQLPDVEVWIAGPEEEDADYARDCHNLVEGLGLGAHIKFLGLQVVDGLLPKVGVVVLSSISEALPLVVLEANAAGVPCVTTDVGACRQLIEGMNDEDRALGASGAVVGIANPEALGRAILDLLTDSEKWHAAQQAGVERVRRYYTEVGMLEQYREEYASALALRTGGAA
ncbi:MAG TPA: glycosyl transferase family 1 [Moraxellaceae bacterium]|nr:glycosyl transferase family 1 [Moraxellaceae bacterium]